MAYVCLEYLGTFWKDYLPGKHGFGLLGDAELKHPHNNITAQALGTSIDQLRIAMRSGLGLPNSLVHTYPEKSKQYKGLWTILSKTCKDGRVRD